MKQSEIETLVDAEIARRRVSGALAPAAPERHWVWTMLRHPLFLSLVAFAVTTGIGGWYDQILKAREDQRRHEQRLIEAANAERDAAMAALGDFARLAYERQVMSDMLRSAIQRGMDAEAIARKAAYDAIYVRWNTGLYLNLLTLRDLAGDPATRSPYEVAVESAILPAFARTDSCLTSAFDISKRLGFPFPPPGEVIVAGTKCGDGDDWTGYLRALRDSTRDCMTAIVSNLMPQLRRRAETVLDPPLTEAERARWRALVHAQLAGVCPGMPAPPEE